MLKIWSGAYGTVARWWNPLGGSEVPSKAVLGLQTLPSLIASCWEMSSCTLLELPATTLCPPWVQTTRSTHPGLNYESFAFSRCYITHSAKLPHCWYNEMNEWVKVKIICKVKENFHTAEFSIGEVLAKTDELMVEETVTTQDINDTLLHYDGSLSSYLCFFSTYLQ